MTRSLALATCLALIFLAGGVLEAQVGAGSLSGVVRDDSGAVLPGALVTADRVPAGVPVSAVTDRAGTYRLGDLPPGTYRVRVELAGFAGVLVERAVAAGPPTVVDVTLPVAPLSEVVTVTRSTRERVEIPNAVSVVGRDEIQAFQRRASPAEALGEIPGMFVENRRNYGLSGGVSVAIRAPLPRFGVRGVQIIQDGVPMTMADGTTEPTSIDLSSLGQVEVVRGPSSVLYGNSAGGVISLRTEFPAPDRLTIEPGIQFGSFGYQQQGLKVSGTSGRFGYLVNASRLETDGFREHSAAEVRRANVLVRAALSSSTEIRGVFNVYDLPFGESPSTLTRADARERPTSVRSLAYSQGWGESTTQAQAGVTLEHDFGGGRVLRATGWGLTRNVWNPIPFSVIDLSRGASGFRSEMSGAWQAGTLPVRWTAGIDISSQRDERAEYDNAGVNAAGRAQEGALQIAQREEVLSASPFVQAMVGLGTRWHVTGGARYDRYRFTATDRFLTDGDQSGERTLDAVSPMAGVTFMAANWLNLYGNVATAYQTPTTLELSNNPSGLGGFNDALEPEDLRSVELGLRGALAPWDLQFELAGYRSRLDNALVQFEGANEQAFFRNAGESRRQGLEARLELKPAPGLQARLAYTWRDYTFVQFATAGGDFAGNAEPGVPPHQLSASAQYDAPSGLHTSVRARHLASYAVNNANTLANWAYTVVDLRVGIAREWVGMQMRPFIGVDNVFGERYNSSVISNSLGNRAFEPAPGREVYVGLTIGARVF